MRGVFTETGVGHDDHFWYGLLTDTRHARHQTVFFPGIAAGLIGVMRNPEGHDRADACISNTFDFARQVFLWNAHHAGHGVDSFVIVEFFFNKDRQHQVI